MRWTDNSMSCWSEGDIKTHLKTKLLLVPQPMKGAVGNLEGASCWEEQGLG